MTTSTAVTGWRITRITGGSGTISHSWFTTAPGCPDTRHPTRWCKCQVHRTQTDALAYIREQEQKEAQNDQH